ncbi:MAG: GMP reductase [Edafosvirus sp.]|uniref:GMP reductase n=1 Tax=Edafosvirus sp. TaxID=2487765 RepID=A0A3G4ZSB6_9VIRU|nr:MAG: GMP reductase [Edafosvirus sp.]
MKIDQDIKLDFQDVLFRPKRSTLSSRNEVDLEREIVFAGKFTWKGVPIIAANMDTIGTFEMYNVLSKFKMITCFHKHYELKDFPENLDPDYYMISTGISEKDWEKLVNLVDNLKPKFICIDVANGYMKTFSDFVKRVRTRYPKIVIACGNVVTREMVEELIINDGADIVKIGIGSGSCCTTRLQTGVGFPQLSSIIECSDGAHASKNYIISDGGCVYPADVAKALGAGSDFVMLGSMLSGHDESAGDVVIEDDKKYKVFYGMSSSTAMNKYSGGVAKYRSSEGRTVKVPYKGPVENTINDILGGIRSTCTYIGAKRLKDIPKCTTFIRVNHQINTVYTGKEHQVK